MKTKLRVTLVYSSKQKAQEVQSGQGQTEPVAGEEEPPDWLAEYDGEDTIDAVAAAIRQCYEVTCAEGDAEVFEFLRRTRPDFVFNISEGFGGLNRESHVPIICEMLDIPCLGSDALTVGICLDKARAKEVMTANGIPTAAFLVADAACDPAVLTRAPLPALVKPLREGSSMGIRNDSLVRSAAELRAKVREVVDLYRQPALVEEFLPGREFTVGLLGNAPDWEILPLVEINHAVLPAGANPVYGYEAKWVWDDPARPLNIHICPADVPEQLAEEIRALALRVARVMRIRDWCRIDMRLDAAGHPKIIELNPLPGILPDPRDNSALPAAARAAGYSYDELIMRVTQTSLQRHGLI
ncbi:MAG: D-alanine--D-alanine ligase [Kiritimatiellia bacterium]|nr:D-alanine--D-alanine ligase [Lentisphaerota bacterium]